MTVMSTLNTNAIKEAECHIINVEAENEHFELCDSVINWIENHKILTRGESDSDLPGVRRSCDTMHAESPDEHETDEDDATSSIKSLHEILPMPTAHHHLSAPGMAWNLVRLYMEKQGPLEHSQESWLPRVEDGHYCDPFEQAISQISSSKSVSPQNQMPLQGNLYIAEQPQTIESLADHNYNTNFEPDIEHVSQENQAMRVRGDDEWAPPRAQIIFNINEESNFRKLMQRQNYRCAGCGTKIDLELARRLVLYCHYLGKYFCKCCFSHKSIHLPGYILQKWDFHRYPVSHFALQLLDRIANEPLFNVNDINASLYRKVKKLRHLIDIRMQLFYIRIYVTTCTQSSQLSEEFANFSHQHLIQDDVHTYSLNNLIEIQHGKLYEYLNDLVTRSIAHIAQCDRCRAKGHYCQLCGPSSFMSSMITATSGQSSLGEHQAAKLRHSHSVGHSMSTQHVSPEKHAEPAQADSGASHSRTPSGNYSALPAPATQQQQPLNDHELIFPFEIGRVTQCRVCGCCYHIQCFKDAGLNCPKCERIEKRRADKQSTLATSTTITSDADESTNHRDYARRRSDQGAPSSSPPASHA